jgi:hypothetical protein
MQNREKTDILELAAMTEPTQAKIEAATRALIKVYKPEFEDVGQSLDELQVLCDYYEIDFIGMAKAALAAAEAAAWQPIETAPTNTPVLVCRNSHTAIGKFVKHRFDGYWIDEQTGRAAKEPPTHWCPLPAPPTAKGEP